MPFYVQYAIGDESLTGKIQISKNQLCKRIAYLNSPGTKIEQLIAGEIDYIKTRLGVYTYRKNS